MSDPSITANIGSLDPLPDGLFQDDDLLEVERVREDPEPNDNFRATWGDLKAAIAEAIGSGAQTGDTLVSARNPGAGWLELDRVYAQAGYPALYTLVGLIGDVPPGRNFAAFVPTTGINTAVNDALWITDKVAVAVGNGIIWRTTDGGTNWSSQAATGNLTQLARVTADIVLAGGTGGTLLRSTDGGATWTAVASGSALNITCITVLSAARVLLHFNSTNTGTSTRVSTNSGASWSAIAAGPTASIAQTVRFSANVVVGFATSNTVAYRSTNGGDSWVTVTIPAVQTAIGGAFAFSDSVGITGSNNPLRTTDSGATWVAITTGLSGSVRAIESAAPGSAVLLTTTTSVVTFDSGMTWSAISTSMTTVLAAFAVPGESILVLANGASWRSLPEYSYDSATQFKTPAIAGLGTGLKGYIKA